MKDTEYRTRGVKKKLPEVFILWAQQGNNEP